MAERALHKRDPWHVSRETGEPTYPKTDRLKIVAAKIRAEYFPNGRKPTWLQERTIQTAAVMVMDLHRAVEIFERGLSLPKDYYTRAARLQALLDRLAPPSAGKPGPKPAQAQAPDLAQIVGGVQ